MAEYLSGLRQLEAERKQLRLTRHARAWKAALEAAHVLRERFGVGRVRAFGLLDRLKDEGS